MIWSLAETLSLLEPHLPATHAVDRHWDGIQHVASSLPEAISAGGLECHLSDSIDSVDFLAGCFGTTEGPKRMVQHFSAQGAANLLQESAWRRAGSFFEAWNAPGTLHDSVPFVWLEFDQPTREGRNPPSVLVCADPSTLEGQRWEAYTKRRAVTQVIDEALVHFVDQPARERKMALVMSCLRNLPPSASLVNLSAMLSREPLMLKLLITLSRDDLLPYLSSIGWPGDVPWAMQAIEDFCPATERLKIDLAIGDTLRPYLGVERSHQPEWSVLLDRAVDRGICGQAARDLIAAWPGSARELFRGHSWHTRLDRWVEAKLLCRQDRTLEVKAYLVFQPYFSLF